MATIKALILSTLIVGLTLGWLFFSPIIIGLFMAVAIFLMLRMEFTEEKEEED